MSSQIKEQEQNSFMNKKPGQNIIFIFVKAYTYISHIADKLFD